MQEELISVIVPVYNVEAYLERCLDSLLEQTYSCLELILVDDGSQDASGEICDAYAAKDSRVRVIHKKNGGLSDARNAGLDQAHGQYVTFVDSDDYVAPSYVEFLYRQVKDYSAEISVCGYVETSQSGQNVQKSDEKIILDGRSAVKDMLYQKNVTVSACGKLYWAPLFQGIHFPKGRLYEDVNTIYKVLLRADQVVCSKQVEYFYFVRPRSIVHSDFQPQKMDYITNTREVMEDMRLHEPDLFPAAVSRFLWANLHILVHLPGKGCEAERRQVLENIRRYRRQVLRDPEVRRLNKLLLRACVHKGELVRWLYRLKQGVGHG